MDGLITSKMPKPSRGNHNKPLSRFKVCIQHSLIVTHTALRIRPLLTLYAVSPVHRTGPMTATCVVGENREIVCVECNLPLEATIFVMEVICALDTVLLLSGQTKLANTCKATWLDIITAPGTYGYNPSNAFMSSNKKKFGIYHRTSIGHCSCSQSGIEICGSNHIRISVKNAFIL
jgi:hypothetical protein